MALKLWYCPTLDPFAAIGSDKALNDFSHNANHGYVTSGSLPFAGDGTNRGRFGMQFDGGNDEVIGTKPAIDGTNVFTVACWVKIDSAGNDISTFYGQYEPGAAGRMLFYVQRSTDRIWIVVEGANADRPALGIAGDNAWHHVRVDCDGSFFRFFIDGVQSGSSQGRTIPNVADVVSQVGFANTIANRHFQGLIDDFRVYDEVLSDTEAGRLITLGRGWQPAEYAPRFGEVASWSASLNDTAAADWAYENVGGNHGALSAGVTTTENNENRGVRGWDFDGVAGREVVTPNVDTLLSDTTIFSVSAWVYLRADGNYPMVVTHANAGGVTTAEQIDLRFFQNTRRPEFALGGSGNIVATSPDAIPLNTWTHLVGTLEGTFGVSMTGRLYVNGVEKASDTGAGSFIGPHPLRFGRRADGFEANALIDSVQLFERTLLADECLEIYEREGRSVGWDLSYNKLLGFGKHAADPFLTMDWPFNESGGTIAADASPFNRTLTGDLAINGAVGPKAYIPASIDLGANSNVLRQTDQTAPDQMNGLERYTVANWSWAADLSNAETRHVWSFGFGNVSAARNSLRAFLGFASIKTQVTAGSGNIIVNYPSVADWLHTAIVKNVPTADVWQDGELRQSGAAVINNDNNDEFHIGAGKTNVVDPHDFPGRVCRTSVWARAFASVEVGEHFHGPEQLYTTLPVFNSAPVEGLEADIDVGAAVLEPRLGVSGLANGNAELRCYFYVADDENGTNQELVAITIYPAGYTPTAGDVGKYLRCDMYRANGGGPGFLAGNDAAEIESTEWATVAAGGPGTYTGSASISNAGAQFAATAENLLYTASATLGVISGAQFSAVATFESDYTATATVTAGGAQFAAVATFEAAFRATATLQNAGASVAASATHAAPVYEATAAVTAGGASLAASALSVAPEFTGNADLTNVGAAFFAQASSATALFVANAQLTAGGGQFSAIAVYTPVSTATATLTAAGAVFQAAAVFIPGAYVPAQRVTIINHNLTVPRAPARLTVPKAPATLTTY